MRLAAGLRVHRHACLNRRGIALGADDAYIVCELPDNAAAAATAMSAAATGMVVNRMVPLLTADEVDRAASAGLAYDAPGS